MLLIPLYKLQLKRKTVRARRRIVLETFQPKLSHSRYFISDFIIHNTEEAAWTDFQNAFVGVGDYFSLIITTFCLGAARLRVQPLWRSGWCIVCFRFVSSQYLVVVRMVEALIKVVIRAYKCIDTYYNSAIIVPDFHECMCHKRIYI